MTGRRRNGAGAHPRDAGPLPARLARRLLAEFGPLLLFFLSNLLMGVVAATGVFMAATALVTAVSWWRSGRLPKVALASTGLVLTFGAMTLLTDDPVWIMVRPTVINGVFGVLLLGATMAGRAPLAWAMGGGIDLPRWAWRLLGIRLGLFLLALAGLNELVWRTVGVDGWVAFKSFAVLPLNLLFLASQWPLLRRHAVSR